MRVQVVDPSAFTPPYDRALCAALAGAGADVELVTSRFLHGSVPAAEGFQVSERFYRRASARGLKAPFRRPRKAAEHLLDMVRFRRAALDADIVHYQWLPVPRLDRHLLPGGAPRVFTAHDVIGGAAAGRPGLARLRAACSPMDAVIAHTEGGAEVLRAKVGLPAERVHVIPHGTLDYLTRLPDETALPPELADVQGPVVLCFGLIRPYKGVDVLIEAFRGIEGAELWIVGRPFGVELEDLREAAEGLPIRFVPRFVEDAELPAYFRRADLVALPHLTVEQSGVTSVALAFGKPMVVSDVGGLGELAREGAGAVAVPPGDAPALREALKRLLGDDAERERLAGAARAARERHSWPAIAERTLAVYRSLLNA